MKKIFGFLVLGMVLGSKGFSSEDASISATKTATIKEGTITYEITYENKGEGTATNVVITDQIPDGTVYISNTAGTGTYSATITYSSDGKSWSKEETDPVIYIRWEIQGNIPPNSSGNVKFAVRRRDE